MTYLDTSALMRLVLREAGALTDVLADAEIISSELLAVESLRTIDRLRLLGRLSIDDAAANRVAVARWLETIDLVLLQRPILSRASEPFPIPLGTLDAIHLSTALVWRDRMQRSLDLATHDVGLATAARTFGFTVRGA